MSVVETVTTISLILKVHGFDNMTGSGSECSYELSAPGRKISASNGGWGYTHVLCRSSMLGIITHLIPPICLRPAMTCSRTKRRASSKLSGGSPLENPPGIPEAAGSRSLCDASVKGPHRIRVSGRLSRRCTMRSSNGLKLRSALCTSWVSFATQATHRLVANTPRGKWTASNDDLHWASTEKICIDTVSAVCYQQDLC
jgi:hypothetical protein